MRFVLKHEIRDRMRLHAVQNRMSFAQADTLQYYLEQQDMIESAKINERICDIVITYSGSREAVISILKKFSYEKTQAPEEYIKNSGRALNHEYWDRLVEKAVLHYGNKIFLPMPVRTVITTVKSVKYIWNGICTLCKGKIEVPVLDATAIGVSVFRGDFVRIHMGNVIPFDGEITEDEAMVNQASLIGESVPVAKKAGVTVRYMQEPLWKRTKLPFASKRQTAPASMRRL